MPPPLSAPGPLNKFYINDQLCMNWLMIGSLQGFFMMLGTFPKAFSQTAAFQGNCSQWWWVYSAVFRKFDHHFKNKHTELLSGSMIRKRFEGYCCEFSMPLYKWKVIRNYAYKRQSQFNVEYEFCKIKILKGLTRVYFKYTKMIHCNLLFLLFILFFLHLFKFNIFIFRVYSQQQQQHQQ